MKNIILTSLVSGTLIQTVFAAPGDLLWSDNFNAGDQGNFDNAPLTGRLGGPLGTVPDCVARSSGIQQSIVSDQLKLGGGRIRFQRSATGPRFDWAGAAPDSTAENIAAAANIIASGGMKISFDYVPTDNTSTNWINVSLGFPVTFDAQAINGAETDYGCLLRNNGGTERFDNGFNKGAGGTFPAPETLDVRHVEYLYAFPDFANGTEVRSRVIVDGVQVAADTFFWDNNSGQLYFVVETNQAGTLVDNLTVSTVPAIYELTASTDRFISGIAADGLVATLSGGTFALGAEPSTFALVEGTGDNDNAKFVIDGDRLEPSGTYDFKEDLDGTLYFVRIRGTGDNTAGTQTQELVLTLIKDDDADGLQDDWELEFSPNQNLTDLNGLAVGPGPGPGTGDFDGDGITDLAEYTYSLGAYPSINPVLADTDGDGLDDGDEINPPGLLRPPTNPIIFDTDKDGLSDGAETNTGIFVSAEDTGTNGMIPDSDLDGARDGFEVEKESDPTDYSSRPPVPPAFALAEITTDESSGISPAKAYTHAISGGGAANVNGVEFSVLDAVTTPANFSWMANGFTLNAIVPTNNGEWNPASGGVTEAGLQALFGGFTYSGSGAEPGRSQTFTLSGLTPGDTYDLRLYIRPWGTVATGTPRPIDLTFINGSLEPEMPFGALMVDRPGIVLNTNNIDTAFYLSYTYVADSTELVINAKVPDSAAAASGSFHMYGLTNQALTEPSGILAVAGVSRDGLGNIVIDFTGAANTTYNVTKSPDLTTPFGPLDIPLTVMTNAAGVGQAIVPAEEASEAKEFYRIEDQPEDGP